MLIRCRYFRQLSMPHRPTPGVRFDVFLTGISWSEDGVRDWKIYTSNKMPRLSGKKCAMYNCIGVLNDVAITIFCVAYRCRAKPVALCVRSSTYDRLRISPYELASL